MTRASEPGRAAAPDLAGLFTAYLRRQQEAQDQGLAAPGQEEVVPHEAGPLQPVDPVQAWHDALAVLTAFPGLDRPPALAVPPDWPALVAGQEPSVPLAFALGNFPQLVRDLHPLLAGDPAAFRPAPGQPLSLAALPDWARGRADAPARLLAAGLLRLARHFDQAADLLAATETPDPAWQAVRANEEAALLWHRGRTEEAAALWQAQPESVPVLFNRGMAALFLGRQDPGPSPLAGAVAGLPETGSWHHLGRLYLALAAARA